VLGEYRESQGLLIPAGGFVAIGNEELDVIDLSTVNMGGA
jgi:hypothetical protein